VNQSLKRKLRMYHNTANQSLMGAYPILNQQQQQQLQQNQQRQNGQLNSMIIKEFENIFKRIEENKTKKLLN
jgi:hypothetical protein